MRRSPLLVLSLACALLACGSKRRTALVVEVDSNLAVPGQMDLVEIVVAANGKSQRQPYSLVGGYALPLRTALVESTDGVGTVDIVATAMIGSAAVVSQEASVAFVEGQTRLLKLFLAAECVGDPCADPSETCTEGGMCVDKVRPPSSLLPFDPSTLAKKRDAGTDAAGDGRAEVGDVSGEAPDIAATKDSSSDVFADAPMQVGDGGQQTGDTSLLEVADAPPRDASIDGTHDRSDSIQIGTGGIVGTGGVLGEAGSGGATGTGGTLGMGGTGTGGRDGGGTGGTVGSGASGSGGTSGLGGLGGTTSTVCGLSTSYGWTSTQSIMDPVSDGSHSLVGIKAPTVVRYNNEYHVVATVVDTAGNYGMQYAVFADWADASHATVDFMDNNPGFSGQHYQPQLFYFSPKKTWYLISQASGPFYSTNPDVTQARNWSAPTVFYSSTPSIVIKNAGTGGIGWTDFWVICDTANCHMFFTNQLGYVFRSQTSIGSFPNGFGEPVLAMPQNSYLREGGRVYKVKGADKYVMTIEGYGSSGRYIGVWSATALDGSWTPMAETEGNPFAGGSNTTYEGGKWTKDVSHGELVRDSYDESMTIDNCNMRYLYAGKDPLSSAKTEPYPWKLGLLVRTE